MGDEEEKIKKIIGDENIVVGTTKSALRLARSMQRELERVLSGLLNLLTSLIGKVVLAQEHYCLFLRQYKF